MESRAEPKQLDGQKSYILKPLIPRRLSNTESKLTAREIKERLTEKGPVEPNLHKPESSVWLKDIFEQLRSKDLDTRLFALWRFKLVFVRMVVTKGQDCASFAAFVFEQGILEEVIRILRAAEYDGDFYLHPNMQRSLDRLRQEGNSTLSKVGMCFRLLHFLMLDARTTRFVRKAIPDLLNLVEGSYFSLPLPIPTDVALGLQDEIKGSSLTVLISLAAHSEQARTQIGSRTFLLHRILQESTEDTGFAIQRVDAAVCLFCNLTAWEISLPDFTEKILKLIVKALACTLTASILTFALSLLETMLEKGRWVYDKLYEAGTDAKAGDIAALLALSCCRGFEARTKPLIYLLLWSMSEQVNVIFAEGRTYFLKQSQLEKLENLMERYPEAIARRQQLQRMFAANGLEVQQGVLLLDTPATLFLERQKEPLNAPLQRVYELPEPSGSFNARPCRKCPCASCSKVETAPCEFKVCNGCRLAVYCSKGTLSTVLGLLVHLNK